MRKISAEANGTVRPRLSSPVLLGLLVLCWLLVALGHYYVVPHAAGRPWLIALADPATHALVAVALTLPFLGTGRIGWPLALLTVSLAVLIDLDHAVAAGSLHPARMVSLPARPLSHSLLFAAAAGGLLAAVLPRRLAGQPRGLLWYLFAMSLASHVLRDAIDSHNTPWTWPAPPPPWADWQFFGLMTLLTGLHYWYAYRWRRSIS